MLSLPEDEEIPETFNVKLIVSDGTNPIDGIGVKLNEVNKSTDSDGIVEYEVEEGNYIIEITDERYDSYSEEINVSDNIETEITLNIKKYNLSVTVTDGENPLGNVDVSIGEISGKTGNQGGCTLSQVPIGEHIITAKLTGYVDYSEEINVVEDGNVTIVMTVE